MIWLIPIEDRKTRVDPALLATLCEGLKKTFNQDCTIQRSVKPPHIGWVAGSNRYIGARLLEALPVKTNTTILGVTGLDLSMIGYDYTSGLSDPPNHRAVISVSRLKSNPDDTFEIGGKYSERVIKRAIHELGHTLGLSHCEDTNCVMFYSDTLDDIDRKNRLFCEKCEAALTERSALHPNAA